MSKMRYWRFLLFNVIGGALWATAFVLLGYFGGAAWHQVAGIASKVGLILLAIIVLGLIVVRVGRNREGLKRFGDGLAARPPLAWIRRRFPRHVAWMRRRLDPGRPQGFLLTFAVTVAALCAWAFGGLTQDVVAHDELALIDPRFERFVVAHRAAWATGLMKSVTWLGSTVVLIPLVLVVGGYFVARRRDWKPLGKLGASLLGAVLLYDIVKSLVARAGRPGYDDRRLLVAPAVPLQLRLREPRGDAGGGQHPDAQDAPAEQPARDQQRRVLLPGGDASPHPGLAVPPVDDVPELGVARRAARFPTSSGR